MSRSLSGPHNIAHSCRFIGRSFYKIFQTYRNLFKAPEFSVEY